MFWKNLENPWIDTRDNRKGIPLLITMLLCFVLFWAYMHAGFGLRELVFNGISAFLGMLIENGIIENKEFAIYDDFNVLAYSFTFILLIPLSYLFTSFSGNLKTGKAAKDPAAKGKLSIPALISLILFLGFGIYSLITTTGMSEEQSLSSAFSSTMLGIAAMLLTALLTLFYVKNGCSRQNALIRREEGINHFFSGFLIGIAILGAALGFIAIFKIYSIKGAGDFHWLSFVLGTLCILAMSWSQEYFFRGAVLSAFGKSNHPLVAILIAAILSSICNYFYFNNVRDMNLLLIVNHLLLGCLLGVLTFRSRSILPAVGVRTAIVFFSQLILGIPFSNYFYVHSLFESKYTTISIWFTTEIIPGVDTGFAMFVMLMLALTIAVLWPAANKSRVESKSYFRHVAEEKPAEQVKPQPVSPAPEPKTESAPVKKPVEPEIPAADEDDDWEEEETRDIGTPTYRAPEDYLKKE